MKNIEEVYKEIHEKTKNDLSGVVEELMEELYIKYLPFVSGDTESNINIQIENCMKEVLAGNYVINGQYLEVNNCFSNGINPRVRIDDRVLKYLYESNRERFENQIIEDQKAYINRLENLIYN